MNYFEKCIAYVRDNPNDYWFKRKLYGWGWVPVRWQGWLVILIFILFLVWNAFNLTPSPTNTELIWFFINIVLSVVIIILICYKTGEAPRWQWGLPKVDSSKNLDPTKK